MGAPRDLRDALRARYEGLTERRAKVQADAVARLAEIDSQIAACRAIYQDWQTMTAMDLVTQLPATGLKVTVD